MKNLRHIFEGIFDTTQDSIENSAVLSLPSVKQWISSIFVGYFSPKYHVTYSNGVLDILSDNPSPKMVNIGIKNPIPSDIHVNELRVESVTFDIPELSPKTMCSVIKAESLYTFCDSIQDINVKMHKGHVDADEYIILSNIKVIKDVDIEFDNSYRYSSIHMNGKQMPVIKKLKTNSERLVVKLECESDIKFNKLFYWNTPITIIDIGSGEETSRDKWDFKMFMSWYNNKNFKFKSIPKPKFKSVEEALKIIDWDPSITSNRDLKLISFYWDKYKVSLIFEKTPIEYSNSILLKDNWRMYWR